LMAHHVYVDHNYVEVESELKSCTFI
jgi:hypothetical protein